MPCITTAGQRRTVSRCYIVIRKWVGRFPLQVIPFPLLRIRARRSRRKLLSEAIHAPFKRSRPGAAIARTVYVCRESQLVSPVSGSRGSFMRTVGIALIVLGIAVFAYGGISWTGKDTVIDAGPIEVTKENRETVVVPPIAAALMVVVGAVLVLKK